MPAFMKFMEMPPPMVPAPSTPDLLDRADRGVVRHVGDLGRGAFGEEVGPLRGRLRAGHQAHEELALGGEAFLEGVRVHRRLDALDVRLGRREAAELAGVGLAEVGEDLRVALGGLELCCCSR
jgi:hypothetical protein